MFLLAFAFSSLFPFFAVFPLKAQYDALHKISSSNGLYHVTQHFSILSKTNSTLVSNTKHKPLYSRRNTLGFSSEIFSLSPLRKTFAFCCGYSNHKLAVIKCWSGLWLVIFLSRRVHFSWGQSFKEMEGVRM